MPIAGGCSVYTRGHFLVMSKEDILPFATTWMDLEDIMLSNKSNKKKQIPYDITYMYNLKRPKS